MKKLILLISISVLSVVAMSQGGVSISSTLATPDASSMLDVTSANKGVLIPRVALTALNVAAPVTTPANSLLVYNTATAGTGPNVVTPGFYYWNAAIPAWERMVSGTIVGTDDQNIDSLVLRGTILTTYIENGSSASVDLASLVDPSSTFTFIRDSLLVDLFFINNAYSYISDSLLKDAGWLSALADSINTDNQDIDSVTLSGNTLTVYIEDGASANVDLSALATDNQNIDSMRLVAGVLTTYIENGTSASVNLTAINTDNQNIDSVTLNGNILTVYIEDGTSSSVDLSALNNNDSSEWTDQGNYILARRAAAAGDTVLVTDSGKMAIGSSDGTAVSNTNPTARLEIRSGGNDIIPGTPITNTNLYGAVVHSKSDFIGMSLLDVDSNLATGSDKNGVIYWGDNTGDDFHLMHIDGVGNQRIHMTVEGDGNVGIGTTVPTELLHIYDSGTAAQTIARIEAKGTGADARLHIVSPSSVTGSFPVLEMYQGAGSSFKIHTDTNLVHLNANNGRDLIFEKGNVGINMLVRPNEVFHVNAAGDSLQFENLAGTGTVLGIDAAGKIFKTTAGLSADSLEWTDQGSYILARRAAASGDTVVVSDNGRIGIGTTVPTQLLDVVSTSGSAYMRVASDTSSNSEAILRMESGGTWSQGIDFGRTGVSTGDAGKLHFYSYAVSDQIAGIGVASDGRGTIIGPTTDPSVYATDARLNVVSTTNPLRLAGMQPGTSDSVMVINSNGIVQYRAASSIAGTEPWFGTDDSAAATLNTEDIYHLGHIAIGGGEAAGAAFTQYSLNLNSDNLVGRSGLRFAVSSTTAAANRIWAVTGVDSQNLTNHQLVSFSTDIDGSSVLSPNNRNFYLRTGAGNLLSSIHNSGNSYLQFNKYGTGIREAGDFGKTASNYIAGFATDGSIIDIHKDSLGGGVSADSAEWTDQGDYILARRAAAGGDTVVVGDNGRVGIGIASPVRPLHVYGQETVAQIESYGTGGTEAALFINAPNAANNGGAELAYRRSGTDQIYTGILKSGNGAYSVSRTNDAGSGSGALSRIDTNGTKTYHFYGKGNKEAGDLSLTQSNYIAAYSTTGTLLEIHKDSLGGGISADSLEWTDQGDYILARRAAAGGDTIVVSDSGRIGIGTTNPSRHLTISPITRDPIIRLDRNSQYSYELYTRAGGIFHLAGRGDGTGGAYGGSSDLTDLMTIHNQGNMVLNGFNTGLNGATITLDEKGSGGIYGPMTLRSVSSTFSENSSIVDAGLHFKRGGNGSNTHNRARESNDTVTSHNHIMTLSYTGNVGIDVLSPKERLHIYANNDSLQFEALAGTGNLLGIDAAGKVFKTTGGVSADSVDLRMVNTNSHITRDAGVGSNGTSAGADSTIAIGAGAGNANSGAHNMFVGTGAGNANTTGSNNVFVGFEAGADNTTVGDLTALGYRALASNTTGVLNTAVGNLALTANTTGQNNTALGYATLASNTTGIDNTGVGRLTMVSNTTGNGNTAMGRGTMRFNTTGSTNTAYGLRSLYTNTTGSANTAVGYVALFHNTTGASNVAVGQSALEDLTTGSNNTVIGTRTGDKITTGSNNIIIGYDIDLPSATDSNKMSIGNLIYGTGIDGTGTAVSSGNVGIGTTTPGAKLDVNGTTIEGGQIWVKRDDGVTNLSNNDIIGSFEFAARHGGGVNDVAKIRGVYTGDGTTRTGSILFATRNNGSFVNAMYVRENGNIGIGTNTPTSTLTVNGSVSKAITTISAAATLDSTHHTVILTPTAAINITLPAASAAPGRIYSFMNRTVHTVTFPSTTYLTASGTGSTVGGFSTLKLQSDGTNWYSIK